MYNEYFDDVDIIYRSLSPKFNREMVFKAGEGAGRSGSFFFFSHDNHFLVKTISKEEVSLYLKLINDFRDHYERNPNSLIARIVGMFRVAIRGKQDIYLMLMENTL